MRVVQLVPASTVNGMRGYVGQTRGGKMMARCIAEGLGEMTQPEEFPPRRYPWVLDNGAFKLWRNGKPFNSERFERVARAAAEHPVKPDFVVAPDVVADAAKSLPLSVAWAPVLRSMGHRVALVVQDGMTAEDVRKVAGLFDVLFVGGSLEWKLETVGSWASLAREVGLSSHVGRMGGRGRVQLAKKMDVDSVDSCVPLFSDANMGTFLRALSDAVQLDLAL